MSNRLTVRDAQANSGGIAHIVVAGQQDKLANPQLSIVATSDGKCVNESGWFSDLSYITPRRQFTENDNLILELDPSIVDLIPNGKAVRVTIRELALESIVSWPHVGPLVDPSLLPDPDVPPSPPPNASTASATSAANDGGAATNSSSPPDQSTSWLSALRSWPTSALNWLRARPLLLYSIAPIILLIFIIFLLYSKSALCFWGNFTTDGSFVRDACLALAIMENPDNSPSSSNQPDPLLISAAHEPLPSEFWQLDSKSPDGTAANDLIIDPSADSKKACVNNGLIFYNRFVIENDHNASMDEQLYWLKLAAKSAHPHALLSLADYYLSADVDADEIDGWDSAQLGLQFARMAFFFGDEATDAHYRDLRSKVRQRLQQNPLTADIASDWYQ